MNCDRSVNCQEVELLDADQDAKAPDDGEDVGPSTEPRTKSDLYKLYGGKGPVAMAHTFAQDSFLQIQAIALAWLTMPVETEYAADLRAMGKGPVHQGQWSAGRAQGSHHWKRTLGEIIHILQSPGIYSRLRLTTPTSSTYDPDREQPGFMQEELKTVEVIWDFGLAMVAEYTVTHIMFGISLPHSFAVFLLPEATERAAAVSIVEIVIRAVLKAHEFIHDGKANADLQECVRDLGWPKLQVALEMIALLLQCNFNPNDESCMAYARKVFQGSSSTKDLLESVFAHLRDVSYKGNKNQRLSNLAKWFYSTTARSQESGGHQRILPTKKALERSFQTNDKAKRHESFNEHMLFDMRTTLLPDSNKFDTPENMSAQKWRPAGPQSHSRSAAAAALLVPQSNCNFTGVGDSWTSSCGLIQAY